MFSNPQFVLLSSYDGLSQYKTIEYINHAMFNFAEKALFIPMNGYSLVTELNRSFELEDGLSFVDLIVKYKFFL